MRKHFLMISAALLLAAPAFAQDGTGTVSGAAVGAVVGGPPGALVGFIIGGTTGASVDARYRYTEGEIARGYVIPTGPTTTKVIYKTVPEKDYVTYLPSYRGQHNLVYTVVDDARPTDRVVAVTPDTHTVVEIVQ